MITEFFSHPLFLIRRVWLCKLAINKENKKTKTHFFVWVEFIIGHEFIFHSGNGKQFQDKI